jgi:5-methylcytosine-specific restriction endonuclease McrA
MARGVLMGSATLTETPEMDDQSLISRLTELLARERELRADFIAYLAEYDQRRLYLVAGYPSLFAWLTEAMRMSKASAYRRVMAARLVGRIPAVLEVLRDGRVSLNKLCAMKDILTPENVDDLLRRVAELSEQDVDELATRMSRPQSPGPRDSIRILLPPTPLPRSEPDLFSPPPAGPVAESPPPPPEPLRRLITMSVGPEFMQLLDDVRAALSHSHPGASLEVVFAECMKVTLAHKARRVRAEVERPQRRKTTAPRGRHVPAEVRRGVWKRDGARCTFVSDDGRRCSATDRLELHHRVPFARGGPTTVDNLVILCSLHNDLAARRDFGDEHMDAFRGASPRASRGGAGTAPRGGRQRRSAARRGKAGSAAKPPPTKPADHARPATSRVHRRG